MSLALRKKCPYLEFFCSFFWSSIRLEYRDLLCKSRIQSEYRQMKNEKTPKTDAFHTMWWSELLLDFYKWLYNHLAKSFVQLLWLFYVRCITNFCHKRISLKISQIMLNVFVWVWDTHTGIANFSQILHR